MAWDIENLKRASVAPGPYGDGYGITLRQHFAGLAMQGILAMLSNPEMTMAFAATAKKQGVDSDTLCASNAVSLADALLAELAKET